MYSEVNGTMLLVLQDVTPYQVMLRLGAENPHTSKFSDPVNGDHYAFFSDKEMAKVYAGSDGTTIMHRLSFRPWYELPNGIEEYMVTNIFLLDAVISNEPAQNVYYYRNGEVFAVRVNDLVVETTANAEHKVTTSSHWNIYCSTAKVSDVINLYDLIASDSIVNDPSELKSFTQRLSISVISQDSEVRHTVIA